MPETIADLCEAIDKMESRSTILAKTEPGFRKQIVQALINRHPPTLREVFDFFALDDKGVSYTAFYYWARKIKRFAALFEMNHTLEEKEDTAGMLPRILASRMLDNALDDGVDVSVLKRMMDTYRMACTIELSKKRLDMQKERLDAHRDLDKAAGDNDILRLARLIARTRHQMDRGESAPTAASPAKSSSSELQK